MLNPTPFQTLLGEAFARLPEPVRFIHGLAERLDTEGLADIEAPPGIGPWLVARLAGLPQPGRNVAVAVAFIPRPQGRERWERRFGRRRYTSTLAVHFRDSSESGFLVEHFGLFDLHFGLVPTADALCWSLLRWKFFRVPLPGWSRPAIECRESSEAGRFTFDIDVVFPLIGKILHYRGWLLPAATTRRPGLAA
jgi:hypothetical protein